MRVKWNEHLTRNDKGGSGRVVQFVTKGDIVLAIIVSDKDNGYGKGHRLVKVPIEHLELDPAGGL